MKNKKKIFLLFVVLFFVAIIAFRLCIIDFDNKKVETIFKSYKDNENEIVELSTNLLNEKLFSKSGIYTLYLSDDDLLKLDVLNYLGDYETYIIEEENKTVNLSSIQEYIAFIKEKNVDKIEVSVYLSEGTTYSKAVTFKHSFWGNLANLWIYYGDNAVFPSCPYDYSRRDNIKNMTDNLYYAFSNILD